MAISLEDLIERVQEIIDDLPDEIAAYRFKGQYAMAEAAEEELEIQQAILERLKSLL